MKRPATPRNILVTFDFSSIAGRDQLSGVLKYLRTRPDWIPRFVARPADFTPGIVHNARREKIDGIIINHAGSQETEAELAQSDIPLAVIGIRNPKLLARTRSIAFIRNDNVETGRMAARYFRSLGNFRSFGYIPASRAGEEWSLSRMEGFRAELASAEAEVSLFSNAANEGTEAARRQLAVWLKGLPKPAAVLAAWDHPAIQALEICRSESIKVPHDIAVLGVDNDPLVCEAATPPLSSIPFDYERQGYESAAALDILISRPSRRVSPVVIACHPLPVVERESAAPIAPASALLKRALRYISRNATRGISTRDVAKALGVSRSLLTLRFREYAGGTVVDAINDVRLKQVRLLLETTRRPIGIITAASGFRSANYLKRLFRRKFGMSMRDYRAGLRA
jgi:LacI family transcriptional regulator